MKKISWKRIKKWLFSEYKFITELETKGIWHHKMNKKYANFIHGIAFGSLIGVIIYVIVHYYIKSIL